MFRLMGSFSSRNRFHLTTSSLGLKGLFLKRPWYFWTFFLKLKIDWYVELPHIVLTSDLPTLAGFEWTWNQRWILTCGWPDPLLFLLPGSRFETDRQTREWRRGECPSRGSHSNCCSLRVSRREISCQILNENDGHSTFQGLTKKISLGNPAVYHDILWRLYILSVILPNKFNFWVENERILERFFPIGWHLGWISDGSKRNENRSSAVSNKLRILLA